MSLQRTWKEFFLNLPENDQGNRNMAVYSLLMQAGNPLNKKVKELKLTEAQSVVFLGADEEKKMLTLHIFP